MENQDQSENGRIRITPAISLGDSEMSFAYMRASGPGGQHVNKVSTAVQLRFDAANSPSLSEHVRERLVALGGRRVTRDGVIVISAQRFRSQERNRQDAVERLATLIASAATVPATRRPTTPTRSSRRKRLQAKRERSAVKGTRRTGFAPDDM